jgi:hypothetical protein
MADAHGQTTDAARPEWFAAFLADRGTRNPSAHTIKVYRQDFDALRGSELGVTRTARCRATESPGALYTELA